MNELVKLRQQIADMEKQATELQKKNRPVVLAQIREQMSAYGITAEELSKPVSRVKTPREPLAKAAVPAKSKKSSKPATPSPTKYRGPEGQEWTGRGTVPKWLKDLMVDGKSREDFLIGKDAAE